MPGRGVDHALEVLDRLLVEGAAVHAPELEAGRVARLDGVDAPLLVLREDLLQVGVVVVDVAARLVVRDEADPLRLRVPEHLVDGDVGLRGDEVLARPRAARVRVPPLGEHVLRPGLGSQVDVLLDALGRRTVLRARVPRGVAALQLPPDAGVGAGVDPVGRVRGAVAVGVDVADRARVVEVLDQVRLGEVTRLPTHLHRAPRRHDVALARVEDRLGPVRQRDQVAHERSRRAVHLREGHARVVGQVGLVHREEQAVVTREGDGRLRRLDVADRSGPVVLLVRAPGRAGLEVVRGEVRREGELGALLGHGERPARQRLLAREHVAEADAVVEHPRDDVDLEARRVAGVHGELVRVVPDGGLRAPGLGPRLVDHVALDRLDGHPARQVDVRVAQHQAEPRGVDDRRRAVAHDVVGEAAVHQADGEVERPVGRRDVVAVELHRGAARGALRRGRGVCGGTGRGGREQRDRQAEADQGPGRGHQRLQTSSAGGGQRCQQGAVRSAAGRPDCRGGVRTASPAGGRQPLTEPDIRPPTKYLPRMMYTSSVGSDASSAPAIDTP